MLMICRCRTRLLIPLRFGSQSIGKPGIAKDRDIVEKMHGISSRQGITSAANQIDCIVRDALCEDTSFHVIALQNPKGSRCCLAHAFVPQRAWIPGAPGQEQIGMRDWQPEHRRQRGFRGAR